mgnify:CR=1 FL=1
MKNNKVVVTLAVLVIAVGAYFLLPVFAHPDGWGNETQGYIPPMWAEEGYNGSYGYGPGHMPYPGCPMWEYDTESGEPEWNPPPWHDPEWTPEEGQSGYGPGCGMMGRGSGSPMGGRGSRRGGTGYGYGGMMGGRG